MRRCAEVSSPKQSFAPEAQAQEPVPFLEVDLGGRVARLDAHDGAVHFGRRAEVVAADFEEVVHSGEELRVGAEAAVLGVARLRDKASGELRLEHQYSGSEEGAVGEQLENLVGGGGREGNPRLNGR